MKIRNTPRVFDTINNLGYKNLLVGGCSFTYNISDNNSSSWPYYIRDKCGFDEVYDCSVQGAGNYQIMTSVVHALETTILDPKDTLIIVMWSGYSRDHDIVGKNVTDDPDYVYNYTGHVNCVINTSHKNKTLHSRAIENYIYVVLLREYLKSKGYNNVFLNFVEPGMPVRDATFDITKFLPRDLANQFKSMFSPVENFYKYCVKNNLLQEDDFHPSMQGHLSWAHNILAPALTANPDTI
jgi:hypothetical protein